MISAVQIAAFVAQPAGFGLAPVHVEIHQVVEGIDRRIPGEHGDQADHGHGQGRKVAQAQKRRHGRRGHIDQAVGRAG